MLEVREIRLANLADCARLCVGTDLPPGLDAFAAVDMQRAKLAFFRRRRDLGAGARAAYRDGKLVGILEWYPVEASPTPVAGTDLFVVNCVRVAERAARSEILGELVRSAGPDWARRAGVAVVARERGWEEFGFEVADRRRAPERGGGMQALWLRRNRPGAEARFLELRAPPRPEPGRVRVDLFLSDRCPWNGYVFDVVRRACASRRPGVQLFEHDCRTREGVERTGVGAGVAVNGEFQPVLRPHLLPDERSMRRILDLA